MTRVRSFAPQRVRALGRMFDTGIYGSRRLRNVQNLNFFQRDNDSFRNIKKEKNIYIYVCKEGLKLHILSLNIIFKKNINTFSLEINYKFFFVTYNNL